MRLDDDFRAAVELLKDLRAPFEQQKIKKNHFEKLVRFDELTYELWGLYQQAVVGNINVPKRDYMDPRELSWMWSWIKGNKKWHAWNGWRGLAQDEAKQLYIEKVAAIAKDLPNLVEQWKDEMDPRIPDEKAWVPDEDKEERLRITEKAKRERRSVVKGWAYFQQPVLNGPFCQPITKNELYILDHAIFILGNWSQNGPFKTGRLNIRDALAAEEEVAMEHRHAQRRANGEPSDTEESDTEDVEDNS